MEKEENKGAEAVKGFALKCHFLAKKKPVKT